MPGSVPVARAPHSPDSVRSPPRDRPPVRAGETAAEHYGLTILASNVEDEPNPLLWPLTIKKDVLDSTNYMVGISTYIDTASGYAYLWGNKTVRISGWNYVYILVFRLPLGALDNPGPNLQYYTTNSTWLNAAGSDLSDVADAVDVPLIASGGVGNLEHLYDGFTKAGASACLAASIFHYREYTIAEAKGYLKERGVPVRL